MREKNSVGYQTYTRLHSLTAENSLTVTGTILSNLIPSTHKRHLHTFCLRLVLVSFLFALPLYGQAQSYLANRQEFVGPFASWVNVKTKYGAKADGITDDTQALQQALNELGTGGQDTPQVLYLPAGTYRITGGLTMAARKNISILGEDPLTTRIKWDGPLDGTMLHLNGVSYSRFGRITWDGATKAKYGVAHMWDGVTGFAVTHNEHSDEAFIDVKFGIRGGLIVNGAHLMDAETSVLRCRFIRNNVGVIIQSFNALDWFIWDSYFEDCTVGATNVGGGGNFHVYNSIFKRSTYADITIANTGFFSIRNNYSINSKAFYVASFIGSNGAQTTFQNNIVLDPLDQTCIRIANKGPVTMLDNIIRSRAEHTTGPIVQTVADLTTVGNTFTVSNAIFCSEKLIRIEDLLQSRANINPAEPVLQASPVKKSRKVFELLPGNVDDTFQKTVDSAAALMGQRPVIHLRAGAYNLRKTVVIPAGTDIQLIGDGYNSRLLWYGLAGEKVLHLQGADKLVLEEFTINANRDQRGVGIALQHSDQAGKQVFMQGVSVWGSQEAGILMEGFKYTNTELHDFYHKDHLKTGVRLIGGGSATAGKLSIFGGASSNNATVSYEVFNGGNLMLQDIWYEGSPKGFLNLSGSGNFTLNGSKIAPTISEEGPVVIDNFNGKVTFLGVQMYGKFIVKGEGSNTNVLALGMQFNTVDAYSNSSANAKAVMLNSRLYSGGSYPLDNIGSADVAFITSMLEGVRKEKPAYKTTTGGVILHRIQVGQALTGIHISPVNNLTQVDDNLQITGIVGYWPLNESSGYLAKDISGNNKNGTLINTPVWTTEGRIKGALEGKDAVGKYIDIPSMTWQPSSFTVSWWLLPYSLYTSGQQILATRGWGAFMFHTTSRGEVFIGTDLINRMTSAELPSGTVEINKWQHFVFTYEKGVGKFYKNGKLLASKSGMQLPMAWGGFKIGNSGSYGIHGKIDDVRVYDRAIALDEVTDISMWDGMASICAANGSILREKWVNLSGTDISSIPLSSVPAFTSQLTSFEAPINNGENYGQRIRGYLCVPVTGNYIFYISGDDRSELWLSNDDDPYTKQKIAYVTGWTSPKDWFKYNTQKSRAIILQAGRKYYIEALHKENLYADHLAVGWVKPNTNSIEVIPGNRLSPYIPQGSGQISREKWVNLSGTDISSIPLNSVPAFTSQLTSFEAPTNNGENYGQRIRGYLHPDINGYYTFYISGDDNCALYLSSDDNPDTKQRIAYINGWTNMKDWLRYTTQKSLPILLIAGRKYYIEALHKENLYADHLAVGWVKPNTNSIEVIPGNRLSLFKTYSNVARYKNIKDSEEVSVDGFMVDIFPNPSIGREIQFTFKNIKTKQEIVIGLFSSTGRLLSSQFWIANKDGELVKNMSLPKNLSTGIYTITIQSEEKIISKKLVIHSFN